jgi:putative ABC transport system ATP-binding protein
MTAQPAPRRCAIEARDVVLSFGQTPALRGASVSVAAGEIVAIMGPSGSGKSTLLHCLAGILVPASGEIYFDGRRIDTMGEAGRSTLRRDHFGFVFQFGQLVPELTAEENIALPLLLSGIRRDSALKEARAWFERLGLDGLERRRSGELSGGPASTSWTSWSRPPANRAPPSSSSPTKPGWPPTPTGTSWSATAK